ncbi:MAG: glycosyltransferase family 39 protein [Desulfovibrio sp.]|nr:glycosyltransferase family 39 protein [Desulfovibrio sp.]
MAIILACGAALRLYHLETPSLWWDEILVPLTASHSLSYIFDFCRSAEMHPPLFYIISKVTLAAGVSDFSLRFLPVVLGIISIYFFYRIVRVFSDEGTALIASAVLAVSGLHILLSREIRPYALQLMLVLWALWLLVRITQSGRWKDLALLAVVNATLFWLHYFTFHIVFAQGVILLLCLLARRPGFDLKRFIVFCLATVFTAWPVFYWFFLPSSGSRSIFSDTQYSRWTVFDLIVNYLGLAAFFFEPVWVRLVAAGLALAGFSILFVRNTWLALICLILVAAPLLNVFALGKAAYFSPWHVAYVTPFLAFFMATALAVAPWRRTIAVAIVICGTVFIFSKEYARYYEVDSYRHNVFVTLFKPVAKHLATALPGGGVTVCSNPGFANGVSWYLDQYVRPNPLRDQQIAPEQKNVTVRFISAFRDFGTLGGDEAAFLAKQGIPESTGDALNAKVYTYKYDHHPIARMTTLPFEGTIEAGLGFFSRIQSLTWLSP